MSPPFDDVCQLAINLARNRGWAVFPCKEDKSPAIPGKGGYKHAKTDQFAVAELWRKWPGELVGVATGAMSGITVLDCDIYKPECAEWSDANQHKIPKTLTFETRQGGYHFVYQHSPGLRCSTSAIGPGIDVKADGGYVISWWCAGFGCLDYRPPAPWPEWLADRPSKEITDRQCSGFRIETTTQTATDDATRRRVESFVTRILSNVECAGGGQKHAVLLRSSRTIGGIIASGGISPSDAQHRIVEALKRNRSKVRDWSVAYRTIRDGLTDGIANPFQLHDRPCSREAA